MHLTWAICHRDGREKGWLWERSAGRVSLELNGPRSASVSCHVDERLGRLVHPGRTRLKVYCHAEIDGDPVKGMLLNGDIMEPRIGEEQFEIPAVDQAERLARAFHMPIASAGVTPTKKAAESMELSESMYRYIELADERAIALGIEFPDDPPPTLRIAKGSLYDTGKQRKVQYHDTRTTWEAILARSETAKGPDFELAPVDSDADDKPVARLNTYKKLGTNKTEDIVLEYDYNLSDLGWEPSSIELCNRYVLVGSSDGSLAPAYVAENLESIRRQGVRQLVESAGDTKDPDDLKEEAIAYVEEHSWVRHFFDLVPSVEIGGTAKGFLRDALGEGIVPAGGGEFAVPPAFGPGDSFDYWLGDTVTVRVDDLYRFGLQSGEEGPQTDYSIRIISAEIEEVDEDGNVGVRLQGVTEEDPAGISGYATTVYVDNGG